MLDNRLTTQIESDESSSKKAWHGRAQTREDDQIFAGAIRSHDFARRRATCLWITS